MNLQVEIEQEEDNRWLAEIPALPGVMAYGPRPSPYVSWRIVWRMAKTYGSHQWIVIPC